MMKLSKILFLSAATLFVACTSYDEAIMPDAALEIKSINATIDGEQTVTTRAVQKLSTAVGRDAFADGDQIVFTTIKRTNTPLEGFTYKDIKYDKAGGSWSRTEGNTPEKIYWTDAHNPHTFIGYSLPSTSYTWTKTTEGYSGELGIGVAENGTIDFSTGNEAIKAEDLLLNYNTNTVAETGGLSTKVGFSHALSNVRVIVNIKNYATSTTSLDAQTVVSDFVIKNQPSKFTWGANSGSLKVLDFANNITKNVKLWCPEENGEGNGLSKTFTFYGLTTPQDATFHDVNGNGKYLEFSFKVTYPDATNPTGPNLEKTYQGAFTSLVNFQSGKCTTLNISLNHKNEEMLIDVTYSDWSYVASPDLGELVKKSTYMEMTIDKVTTHFDDGLIIDDATWLYVDHNDEDKVKDIYGHTGSSADPYIIKSAAQMLSFAKEVNSGNNFAGQYVRLDADITMQSSATAEGYLWEGIGEGGKEFNGTFLGGDRYINRLSGSPLFVNLGADACVEQLYITAIGEVSTGALAGTNNGIIGGCKVIDDVTLSGTNAGVLVGSNYGTIHACYYTGEGNLIGTDSGTTKGCYTVGDISSFTESDLKKLVTTLNGELSDLYDGKTISGKFKTKFKYTYTIGNYPTVQVAP